MSAKGKHQVQYYSDESCGDFDSDGSSDDIQETMNTKDLVAKFFEAIRGMTILVARTKLFHFPTYHGQCGFGAHFTLDALLSHAMAKKTVRLNIHVELTKNLRSKIEALSNEKAEGNFFRLWRFLNKAGLTEIVWPPVHNMDQPDHTILWPPTMIIQNTGLGKKDPKTPKWSGMGNLELVSYFKEYELVTACQTYGLKGHRGMGALVFAKIAGGYYQAERLHMECVKQGCGRVAWSCGDRDFSGGLHQLFSFRAAIEDIDFFNHHLHGKTRLKYEMKPFSEMVAKEVRGLALAKAGEHQEKDN